MYIFLIQFIKPIKLAKKTKNNTQVSVFGFCT